MRDQRARRARGGGAEHQGGDVGIGRDQFADDARTLALAHANGGIPVDAFDAESDEESVESGFARSALRSRNLSQTAPARILKQTKMKQQPKQQNPAPPKEVHSSDPPESGGEGPDHGLVDSSDDEDGTSKSWKAWQRRRQQRSEQRWRRQISWKRHEEEVTKGEVERIAGEAGPEGSITGLRRDADEAAGNAINTRRQMANPRPKPKTRFGQKCACSAGCECEKGKQEETPQREKEREHSISAKKGEVHHLGKGSRSHAAELNPCETHNEWKPMPRPMIVDSGAADTVLPRTWFTSHPLCPTEASKNGDFFITANGEEIDNEGARRLTLCTPDWGNLRNMEFAVTDVNKALGSVSKMVKNGNRVVFDASGSFIESHQTGEKMWLREDNGVFVLDVLVAPPGYRDTGESTAGQGFPRPR